MTLTKQWPLQDFSPLWDAMDRFIADGFGSNGGWSNWGMNRVHGLPLEVYETPEQFVVRGFAPGVTPDRLAVEFDNGTLTIRAKVDAPELKDGWRTYLAEFPYGEYTRQLRLPRTVDVEKIQSSFEHGVLTLLLPKIETARPHRIEIRTPAQLGAGSANDASGAAETSGR